MGTKPGGWFVALALVGNIAPFFVISWGQQHISSALAGILIGFTPLATLAIARIFVPEDRITPMRIAGFAIGFAGLVVVIGPGALADLTAGGDRLLGQFAVLAGAFFFACNNVMARRAPDMPLVAKSSGVMLAGALIGTAMASTATPPAALAEAGDGLASRRGGTRHLLDRTGRPHLLPSRRQGGPDLRFAHQLPRSRLRGSGGLPRLR